MRPSLLLPALLLAGCQLTGDFRVSGSITVASSLQDSLPKTNAVLFIVVKNRGGVPIAIHRVVNPQFPVVYNLTVSDLLIPGSRPKGPFWVEVHMNSHGNVGRPARSDLFGSHKSAVLSGESGVHIVIDGRI